MNRFLRVYSIYVPDCEKTAIRFRFLQPEPAYGIHMMGVSGAPPVNDLIWSRISSAPPLMENKNVQFHPMCYRIHGGISPWIKHY